MVYYDLDVLSNASHEIDRLIAYVVTENARELKEYHVESRMYKGFHEVTLDLVKTFKNMAYAHVKHIKDHPRKYGHLYLIARDKSPYRTAVFFDYNAFSLIQNGVLPKIESIARELSPAGTEFSVTCIYLLYFYALIVNPDCNWFTLDYLMNCNRFHQYLTWLDWNDQDLHVTESNNKGWCE
jgi:hypothetical protein